MQSKKILIALNHPAHYYLFKYSALMLQDKGYELKYVIKNKDVLEELLINECVDYIKYDIKKLSKQNKLLLLSKKTLEVVQQDVKLLKVIKTWAPDLMIGTDIAITHVGKLLKIPSFVFNEDDFEINKEFCRASYPFATKIIAPFICSVGKYEAKRIGYNGMQKMAYLHPKYFKPDKSQINAYVRDNEDYFIIRTVSLNAGHDIMSKNVGLNEVIIDKLIIELKNRGKVFISSEDEINNKYDEFKVNIKPNKMHHFLANAALVIGDSQTMCAEAGLLGTPFIRYNSFVGKINYLNEIELKYKLGFGISANQPEKLIEKTIELLSTSNLKMVWKQRQDTIFKEKIDAAMFYTQLIEKYLAK